MVCAAARRRSQRGQGKLQRHVLPSIEVRPWMASNESKGITGLTFYSRWTSQPARRQPASQAPSRGPSNSPIRLFARRRHGPKEQVRSDERPVRRIAPPCDSASTIPRSTLRFLPCLPGQSPPSPQCRRCAGPTAERRSRSWGRTDGLGPKFPHGEPGRAPGPLFPGRATRPAELHPGGLRAIGCQRGCRKKS